MKVTMNTVNDYCLDANIHCQPAELLIIYKALRLMAENESVDESDRREATGMRETLISFCEREKA